MIVSKELLELLACPVCKIEVKLQDDRILCEKCGRKFPIHDGIPVMLVEEAELPEGAEPTEEENL
ncbi:MAG: Trm112 family protein [Planctomycetota bacterium]